ncbi:MAG: hypothetical protein SVT56_04965 [Chloroflexota bacterium]|nr:hypothetical protein [Chloroflexota bacterium]
MAYVTYSYYTDTYGGNAIAEADFDALAIRASDRIDYLTFDRAADIIDADTPAATVTAIKKATCAVAEVLHKIDQGDQGGIKSESVGGHSVAYAEGSIKLMGEDARCALAARRYLVRTGLMYAGFNDGEHVGTFESDD